MPDRFVAGPRGFAVWAPLLYTPMAYSGIHASIFADIHWEIDYFGKQHSLDSVDSVVGPNRVGRSEEKIVLNLILSWKSCLKFYLSGLKPKTKTKIYNSLIIPDLLYGEEVWTRTTTHEFALGDLRAKNLWSPARSPCKKQRLGHVARTDKNSLA